MKNLIIPIIAILICFTACKSSKDTVETETATVRSETDKPRGGKGQKGMRDYSEMLAQMDVNKDGLLAKTEVKGRLAKNFDKIDLNNDGFLSEEEIKNAPKPQRGQRGQRN